MKKLTIGLILAFLFTCIVNNGYAQSNKDVSALNDKEQSIVAVAAFTARGNEVKLKQAINSGLNAGLTVNEIKEILVQLYAYAGFPRSLNALHAFMAVLKERQAKGVHDEVGKEPSPLPAGTNKLQTGTNIQTSLVGREIKGEVYEFAPAIDAFLKEHLFGDIFSRDNIDWKWRELATVAALASMGGVKNQLRGHFGVSLYNGVTATQLRSLVSIIKNKVDAKEGKKAAALLQTVLVERKGNDRTTPNANSLVVQNEPLFGKGEKLTASNFTGTAYLQQLVLADSLNQTAVGNVTFEPGARSYWHMHPGGQILLVTGGEGYYQEKGSPKKVLRKGDVVKCPPNVAHWHGASHNSRFEQVAITSREHGPTVWLQPVSDEEYNAPL